MEQNEGLFVEIEWGVQKLWAFKVIKNDKKLKTLNNNNTISLSCHEQVCLLRLRFQKYFSHQPDDGRSISQSVASLNMLAHDMINLLYYEHWTDKWEYFYVYFNKFDSEFSRNVGQILNSAGYVEF